MKRAKKEWEWQRSFDRILKFAEANGGDVVKATDKHVAFRYLNGKVRVVFYPHRLPSARAYSLRVRVEGAAKDASLETIRHINRSGDHREEFWVNNRGWPGNAQGMEWGK